MFDDEPSDAWLAKLGVAAQMLLSPDARLLGLAVLVRVGRAQQGTVLVDLDGPALINEVDQGVGGCRQPGLVVEVAKLGRSDPERVVQGDCRDQTARGRAGCIAE